MLANKLGELIAGKYLEQHLSDKEGIYDHQFQIPKLHLEKLPANSHQDDSQDLPWKNA